MNENMANETLRKAFAMRKMILALAAAAATVTAVPAAADPPSWAPAHGRRAHDREAEYRRYDGYDRRYDDNDRRYNGYDGYDRGNQNRGTYDPYGRYYEPRVLGRGDQVWQGTDGRYYCRRGNGTTGLIIGGAAGALLGRALDGGRSRTLGTLLGGAAGALLGREVARGGMRCR